MTAAEHETPEELAGRVVAREVARLRGEADSLRALADLMEREVGHLPGVGAGEAEKPRTGPEAAEALRRQNEMDDRARFAIDIEDGDEQRRRLRWDTDGGIVDLPPEAREFVERFDERLFEVPGIFARAANEALDLGMDLHGKTANQTAAWVQNRIRDMRQTEGRDDG